MINHRMIISWLFYTFGCLAIAFVITSLHAFTRPIQARGEMRSWRVLLGMLLVVAVFPYGAIEVMTSQFGKSMKPAIEEAYAAAGVSGEMKKFKVLFYTGSTARVMAIGEERASWGGMDKNIVKISLKKKDKDWQAESYDIAFSDTKGVDSIIIPPY